MLKVIYLKTIRMVPGFDIISCSHVLPADEVMERFTSLTGENKESWIKKKKISLTPPHPFSLSLLFIPLSLGLSHTPLFSISYLFLSLSPSLSLSACISLSSLSACISFSLSLSLPPPSPLFSFFCALCAKTDFWLNGDLLHLFHFMKPLKYN